MLMKDHLSRWKRPNCNDHGFTAWKPLNKKKKTQQRHHHMPTEQENITGANFQSRKHFHPFSRGGNKNKNDVQRDDFSKFQFNQSQTKCLCEREDCFIVPTHQPVLRHFPSFLEIDCWKLTPPARARLGYCSSKCRMLLVFVFLFSLCCVYVRGIWGVGGREGGLMVHCFRARRVFPDWI